MATKLTNTTSNIPILNRALQDIDTLKAQVASLQTLVNLNQPPLRVTKALNFGTIAAHSTVTLNVSVPTTAILSAAFASPNAALTQPAAGSLVWCAAVINSGLVQVSLINTDQTNSVTPGAALWTIVAM